MDGRILMYVLLVFVWCSFDGGGFMMVVTAQPTLIAYIGRTPKGSRVEESEPVKEGEYVQLKCVATNLQSNQTVVMEWSTRDPLPPLTLDNATGTANNKRFLLVLSTLGNTSTLFDLKISSVLRGDAGDYVCTMYEPTQTGDNIIVNTSSVTLSVFYFPNESCPICSPAGPITVDAGTELDMTCSSESSNGTVTMTINPTVQTTTHTTWTPVLNDDLDTIVSSSDLKVDNADNGTEFECIISSTIYANMTRTCKIGPLTVRELETKPTSDSKTLSTSSTVESSTSSMVRLSISPQPQSISAVVVGVATGGAAFLLLVILIVIICRKRLFSSSDLKLRQYTTPGINQTNTESTLDKLEHSPQVSFNEHGKNRHSIPEGLQDNIIYNSYRSGPDDSYSTADASYLSPLYAKSIRSQTQRDVHETTRQQPDLSGDSATKLSYINPAYDSNVSDETTLPSGDGLYACIKPTALVEPFQHTEPEASTTPERNSNTWSNPDDHMAPSSTPPLYPDTGTPNQENTHSPSDDTLYALVSRLISDQSSHDNQDSDNPTDLNLQSDENQYGAYRPPSPSESPIYAKVMKN